MNFAFHISLLPKVAVTIFFGGVEGKGHWLTQTCLFEMINDVNAL